MADISKITVGSTTYNIKDATARNSIRWQTPTRLVNATWAADETKTVSNAVNFLIFGATRSGSARMSIGTWSYPTSTSTASTSVQNVALSTGYDNGTNSYIDKFSFSVAGKTAWTLKSASTHYMSGSGYSGSGWYDTNHNTALWGLI